MDPTTEIEVPPRYLSVSPVAPTVSPLTTPPRSPQAEDYDSQATIDDPSIDHSEGENTHNGSWGKTHITSRVQANSPPPVLQFWNPHSFLETSERLSLRIDTQSAPPLWCGVRQVLSNVRNESDSSTVSPSEPCLYQRDNSRGNGRYYNAHDSHSYVPSPSASGIMDEDYMAANVDSLATARSRLVEELVYETIKARHAEKTSFDSYIERERRVRGKKVPGRLGMPREKTNIDKLIEALEWVKREEEEEEEEEEREQVSRKRKRRKMK
ncbi:hypothetical protein TWF718_010964 [Orbilia javanica]|uniref:Uncharacterized protein n=1 Tax=Orbilia javanica TaxID=47235 RepID=A0AAN8MPB3_9PEZI